VQGTKISLKVYGVSMSPSITDGNAKVVPKQLNVTEIHDGSIDDIVYNLDSDEDLEYESGLEHPHCTQGPLPNNDLEPPLYMHWQPPCSDADLEPPHCTQGPWLDNDFELPPYVQPPHADADLELPPCGQPPRVDSDSTFSSLLPAQIHEMNLKRKLMDSDDELVSDEDEIVRGVDGTLIIANKSNKLISQRLTSTVRFNFLILKLN
jgi:hypothetical protein